MKSFIFIFVCLISAAWLYAQEGAGRDPAETARFNTIKYGTETEIAALIQTLKNEGTDYLDDEIIALVGNTRNQKILGGAFAFFAEREKGGLEYRAIRAIEEWDDEETETVLAAIDYIGRVKAAAAAPVLRELLDTGERRFMNAAFRSLGRVSGTEAGNSAGPADETAEYLIDFYENRDTASENHRDMITAMGATGSVKAVPFLAGIAGDNEERPVLRMAALESLAQIGNGTADGSGTADPAGLEAILACVSARDPNVRSAAVTALGPFSGKAVDDAILDAFRDSYYRTRIAAAQASRRRKLAAAIPYLQFRAERDEVPAVREESIRALGAIAVREAIDVLESLFTERKNSDRVRIAAGEMLMQNEPERFLDSFIKELDEAKQKNQNALYNGLLRIIGNTKSAGLETITRRLMQNSGVVERSYALDMAANNNMKSLAGEIRAIAGDRNEGLARKARRTMEKLGLPAEAAGDS
jgi:HEAT repeat protein